MPPRPRKIPILNDAGQPRRDQAHAVDLRHHVGERAQDRGEDADGPRDVAAVARAEKVRDRELAELAQVRRQEQRDQAVAAGPAHDEREAAEAGQVQRAGHADERRGAHPVRAGRHAVEHRGHAPAGDVVLGSVGRAAHDADAGVEARPSPAGRCSRSMPRQAHLLGDGEQDHEGDEAARVERVDLLQLRLEALVRAGEKTPPSRLLAAIIRPPLRARRIRGRGCSCTARSTR